MSRCLVTGHKGYIGSEVFKTLKEMGHEVVGIDLKDGKDILKVLKPDTDGKFHPHWTSFRPEYIFHLAAIPRVQYSVEHPVEVLENNVLSTLYILEFARAMGCKRVIYSSSSSVVGNGDGPENPYGASKLMPETICKVWSKLYDVDTVCLRYFNVYSPDQKAEGPYSTAIANWMQYIRDNKQPYITGDGEQRRDMTHKMDAVSANIFCMEREERFFGQHFDVGTGQNISLNEVKEVINTHFPDVEFTYTEPRAGDVMSTIANMAPLEKLNWKPKYNIKDGINSCFEILKREIS